MTPNLKESWLSLTTRLGERITGMYEDVAAGLSGQLWTKTGKDWKKFSTLLAQDALILFHDAEVR